MKNYFLILTHILKYIIFFLSLTIFSFFAIGQQPSIRYGTPFYKNYAPKDYHGHSQMWNAIQLSNGLMLLGTTEQIILFDGIHWQHINNNKVIGLRTFFNDTATNTIYFGGDGSFGKIRFESTGKPSITLLSNNLQDNDKNFYTILSIVKKQGKIYFIGLHKIFIYKRYYPI